MKISKIEIPQKTPETFEELYSFFLPRPIHDEAENAEMIRVMDWIAVPAQNRAQFDYAKMLWDLVTEYEIAQQSKGKIKAQRVGTLESGHRIKRLDASGAGEGLGRRARYCFEDHDGRAADYRGSRQACVPIFKMAPEAFLDLE